jgi:mannose-6-phosphate isomerase-like protein (cupin superfamily)
MEPYVLRRDEGPAIWMFDALDTVKADADRTGGTFSLLEFLDFEGSTVPLHANERWDRGFYVLDGRYTFVIRETVHSASAGTWIFVPRDVVHAWRCDSSEGRLLNVTVPGGFEEFYREVGQSLTDRGRLPAKTAPDLAVVSMAAAKYGVRIVGPPPDASHT